MHELSELQASAFLELFNLGIGKAASTLSHLTQSHIQLRVPELKFLNEEQTHAEVASFSDSACAIVNLDFHGSFSGCSAVVFTPEHASKLVTILCGEGEKNYDFDRLLTETLTEVGNIVVNSAIGTVSNELHETVSYSIPIFKCQKLSNFISQDFASIKPANILIKANFKIESINIEGEILFLFDLLTLNKLIQAIEQHVIS